MSPTNDPIRNRPADEGRNNDPNLRDDSGQQPGVNTMSSSEIDDDFDAETEDVLQNEPVRDFEDNADPAFDEIGKNANEEGE